MAFNRLSAKESPMSKIGLLARFEAKPEYADQIAKLLHDAVDLAHEEDFTVTWYAFRESETVFGIFDTFADEYGRTHHMEGKIAQALMGAADTMLIAPPDIKEIDLIGVKN
jgi:quinol monooxygenase YgiN